MILNPDTDIPTNSRGFSNISYTVGSPSVDFNKGKTLKFENEIINTICDSLKSSLLMREPGHLYVRGAEGKLSLGLV